MAKGKILRSLLAFGLTGALSLSMLAASVSAATQTGYGYIDKYVSSSCRLQDYKDLVNTISDGLYSHSDSIDISSFKIPRGEAQTTLSGIYFAVLATRPELFYVDRELSWYRDSNYITDLCPQYNMTKTESQSALTEFYNEADHYLALASGKLSRCGDDFSRAVTIHDEIVLDAAYDNVNYENNNHTFMIDKTGVCENYSRVYAYLLAQLGMYSEIVSSDDMNHEWVLAKIDGKYYHVDTTWDDPLVDRPGRVSHTFFLLSSNKIGQSIDGKEAHTGYSTVHSATSTKYDSAAYHSFRSKLCKIDPDDTYVYAISSSGIVKYDYSANTSTTLKAITDKWYASGSSGSYYTGLYSGLAQNNGLLYYNTPDAIYSYDVATGATSLVYSNSYTNKIYGLYIRDSKLYGVFASNPNVTGTVRQIKTLPAETGPFVEVTSVSLSTSSMTLEVGQTATVTATVAPSDATDKTITWSSSNTDVATVSGGKITARSAGRAIIKATSSNGKSASVIVTVKEPVVEVTSVSISNYSLSLEVGQSSTVTATVNPSNATDQTITWSSSNTDVATVSNGTITAVSVGRAVIKAKSSNDKSASVIVTVKEPVVEVTSVSISNYSLSLEVGQSATVTATVNPSNATDQTITWSSSNTDVATVSDGTITAISAGRAVIKAKSSNDKSASVIVTVKEPVVEVTEVSLSTSSVELEEGQTTEVFAVVVPSDATDTFITWASSDTSVADVNDGIITAVGEGTATITAVASNGVGAELTVTVKKPVVEVTSIVLSRSTANLLEGRSTTATATIEPSDATDKTVTWTSSDPSIATVSNGRITAVSAGKATITAATSNGLTATVAVTVKPAVVEVTSVELSKSTTNLVIGHSTTVKATVSPTGATNKTLIWTSSDTSVATVADGKITAVGGGTATVTAESNNGITASLTVKVTVPATGITLSKSTTNLVIGHSTTVRATVAPADATNKTVKWSSSDTSIATVSNGRITAVGGGTATVTAKTSNGLTATLTVKVSVPATSITLSKSTVNLAVDHSTTVKAELAPTDVTNKTVKWSSSDTSVATVSGGKITALKKGTATVTATTSNGLTATVTVNVKA